MFKESAQGIKDMFAKYDNQNFGSLSNTTAKKQVATGSSKQNNKSSPEMMKLQVTSPSKAVVSLDSTLSELPDTDFSNVTSPTKILPQPTSAKANANANANSNFLSFLKWSDHDNHS